MHSNFFYARAVSHLDMTSTLDGTRMHLRETGGGMPFSPFWHGCETIVPVRLLGVSDGMREKQNRSRADGISVR